MYLICYYILAFCVTLLNIKLVTGQNRFAKFAPFVEHIIKQHADKAVESEYKTGILKLCNQYY